MARNPFGKDSDTKVIPVVQNPLNLNYKDLAQKYLQENERTIIEDTQIKRLGKVFTGDKVQLRPVFEIEIRLSGENKTFEMIIDTQKEMGYSVIIGRKDLKEYLIDPSKTFTR